MFQGNVRQKDDKNLLYAATDTDQEDEYSTVQKRYKSAVLSYHNITYSLQVRYRGFACCAKYKDRDILRELSGVMKPGMNAILGPTGSGKTSLLDILAGRKEVGTIDGTVLLDGFPLPKTFKCMSGYVVQDDIVMGTLTVRENLNFSAALRLPGKKTSQERQARVDAVLLDLGLQHVADSMVGNEYIRGISGGERKRTNIGMELIIAPSVLFLDEPTTGLDAYTAVSVMQLLQCLSKKGKTIIFSIHQPRYSIVKLFDTITLLGNGQTVYHGPASKALTYFEQIGYDCEEHDNPADFFLDTIQNVTAEEERELRDPSLPVRYERSDYAQHAQSELAEIHDGFLNQDSKPQPAERAGYPRSRPYQFFIVSKRSFLNIIRTPGASIIQIMIYVILAVIVGGIYYQLGHSSKDGIQNRSAILLTM
jgi:ATP-binding cassette subfamily G (WHITE) protein 2